MIILWKAVWLFFGKLKIINFIESKIGVNYMEDRILVSNIQRFSLHDGPGIRTTVFLKGCSLRCPWCSNPENISFSIQKYVKDGIKGVYGKWYKPQELLQEVLKDKFFYEWQDYNWMSNNIRQDILSTGGVTFSGGECLLQILQLIPVLIKLKDEGVHTAVETCLFVPKENLLLALKYIDFFYVDVKVLDKEKCREFENGELALYLRNLEVLFNWRNELGNCKPVVIRVPVIGNRTDMWANRKAVKDLLKRFKDRILKIELIKEHNLGAEKYKSLNMQSSYYGVSDSLMNIYKEELESLNIPIELCNV